MALKIYRAKRKFDVTPEPRGRKGARGGNQYVIQKHDATRLHYDLRLELDGVMKSWAVTKGPSLVPGEKRLAVHVEDHPIEYNSFEGTIPEGQYGGGTVMIWDRGTWEPEGDPHKTYAKGHLDFTLDGKKLKGRWHLVRMRSRPGEKRENWLLIKADDKAARTPEEPDILEQKAKSVVSGRSLEQIARADGPVWNSNRAEEPEETKSLRRRKAAATRKTSAREATAKTSVAARKPASPSTKTAAKRSTTRPVAAALSVLREETASGRTTGKRPRAPASAKAAVLPDFIEPCLATLRERAPGGDGWIHEIKFDGYRIQARLDHGEVTLKTRKALDWTHKFTRVAEAVAKLKARTALIDGEVVVETGHGVSFSELQADLSAGRQDRMAYYVFDLLHLDGRDLSRETQLDRKAALRELLDRSKATGTIRYSEHFDDDGSMVHDHACRLGLEGIVSKQRDAPYRPGRSDTWFKTKCSASQEFVIAGFEPSEVAQRGLRSLVLGYHEDGTFKYAGRVGTGFSHKIALSLWRRLKGMETDANPFGRMPEEERRRNVHWVEPRLVAEIDFRGWTGARRVRQASFKGLREDKPAAEIVREEPMPASKQPSARKSAPRKAKTTRTAAAARKTSADETSVVEQEHPDVHFTHPDRVYWVDIGLTKIELAEYYNAIWDWIAPHVVRRPLALVRCPDGTKGQCFFQKHAAAGLVSERIGRHKDAKGEELIYIDDLEGLLTLVQAGVLEIHVWGSTIDRVEQCDRIVFDLDPGDGVAWSAVNIAARELRARLNELDLTSFVKTSGGKGLHVVVPTTGTPWEEAKGFAHALTLAMAADSPQKYVSKMTKSLREGKIFIDYLRNGRGATSVVAYSTRARAGAPVSVPVGWEELGASVKPDQFTVLNLQKRLARLSKDPWAEIAKVKQKLPKF